MFHGYVYARLTEPITGKEVPVMVKNGKMIRPDYYYASFKKGLEDAGMRYLPVSHL